MTIAFVSTPFTDYATGHTAAYVDASKIVAQLIASGVHAYSPIAHCYPAAVHGNLDPLDLSIWYPYNTAMMAVCDVLVVAHLDGWRESKGVAYEVDYFEKAGKPIFDLDPEMSPLKMVRRT